MTLNQIDALNRLARFTREAFGEKWTTAPNICAKTGVMGSLVRAGLARSCDQSERTWGERRYVYKLYQITEAGLDYLAKRQPK